MKTSKSPTTSVGQSSLIARPLALCQGIKKARGSRKKPWNFVKSYREMMQNHLSIPFGNVWRLHAITLVETKKFKPPSSRFSFSRDLWTIQWTITTNHWQLGGHQTKFLGGGWALPLWKIWKSIGMMMFPIYGKIKVMFQTTNQTKDVLFFLIIQMTHWHMFWVAMHRPLKNTQKTWATKRCEKSMDSTYHAIFLLVDW